MTRISRSRNLGAKPQSVWDVLADFDALDQWADNVAHSSILHAVADSGVGVGTSRRVQVGRNTLVETVIESAEPTVLAYSIEGLPKRVGRLINRWTLRPTGAGTEVTLTSSVDSGSGPVAAAVEWVAARALGKQSEALLDGLTRRMEQS